MISAVILTHNNEESLSRTLASLRWCNELVVIDDYSCDKTVEIGKRFSAKVFQRHLNGDFAGQRNFGLAKARGEWVLFVDSDEVITKELAQEIKKAISSKPEVINGYYFRRKDYFLGRWLNYGETRRVRLLRLAKKKAGAWQRPVHEVWQVKGKVGQFNYPLLHYPHPNVAQFIEETNYYSTINAQHLYAQGIWVSWWQLPAYPAAKLWLNYFWRLGFLDGAAGAITALIMSFHSFLTRAKLFLLWQGQNRT